MMKQEQSSLAVSDPESLPPPDGVDVSSKGGIVNRMHGLVNKVVRFGRVEVRGIAPIPVKERTVTTTVNVFTLWWSMSINILP